jgi:hypothetical protein
MGVLQMRQIVMNYAVLLALCLAGCNSSSRENQAAEVSQASPAKPANPDLLSIDGDLLPLSTFFGVCVRHANILRSTYDNGMLSPHFPTYANFVGGGGELKITVGKFDTYPGTVLKDLPATSLPRRIRIGRDRFASFVLVSDFNGAGNNLVSISYDEKDAKAKAEAIRLANNVVSCHVSAVTSKPKP